MWAQLRALFWGQQVALQASTWLQSAISLLLRRRRRGQCGCCCCCSQQAPSPSIMLPGGGGGGNVAAAADNGSIWGYGLVPYLNQQWIPWDEVMPDEKRQVWLHPNTDYSPPTAHDPVNVFS
ncbi:hypothetical protein CEUSTIGMA_g3640.t1 [Chlamydomonas eustigma]|uniref:WW domain-containing protein n=1 Tax=Chlamydomonas eustigma TaxID=1157962 RepID=A0A250WZI9_9CHLO|nr:hypothetical protein CEUSTIGMA_g3640.t1 [Chlamydomonas eustigma]|eukprot:GAX76196.1 hypothetical protein CEUSTIGMA_g3640.t1 [Chlamydomonas eustigma]